MQYYSLKRPVDGDYYYTSLNCKTSSAEVAVDLGAFLFACLFLQGTIY
jgi:hypothetical protein